MRGLVAVIGIEQNYDIVLQYCQAFREEYVYSHRKFLGNPSAHTLIRCFDIDARPRSITSAILMPEVRFITGSGHGSYNKFTGQHGVTIWNTSSRLPRHVDGKIIHLLSCRVGGLLGLHLVQRGAAAFWGYTIDFKFYHQQPSAIPMHSDIYAKPFFQLDAVIDIGILNGYDSTKILDHMEAEFLKAYRLLIADPRGSASASALLDNFIHLVSPGRIWGDPAATL